MKGFVGNCDPGSTPGQDTPRGSHLQWKRQKGSRKASFKLPTSNRFGTGY